MDNDRIGATLEELVCSKDFEIMDFPKILNMTFYPFLSSTVLIRIAKKAVSIYGNQVMESFYNILQYIRIKNEKCVIDFALSFIVDLKGENREAGRNVWDKLLLHKSKFDALNLTQEHQALFIISMLQDLSNPKYRLPKVMPLFNSTDENIRLILYMEIVKYCDYYINIVKEHFDKYVTLTSEQSKNFEKYYENYISFLQQRAGCKELSSKYSHPYLYEETRRVIKNKMRDISVGVEREIEQNLNGVIKKIHFARGYTFREADGELRTPEQVNHPFFFPASINALSALESTEYMLKMNDNWDKIKSICEIL